MTSAFQDLAIGQTRLPKILSPGLVSMNNPSDITQNPRISSCNASVADPGGQSGQATPSKLGMEFGPLGERKNNYGFVNLSKCKEFPPPHISMLATDLAPY